MSGDVSVGDSVCLHSLVQHSCTSSAVSVASKALSTSARARGSSRERLLRLRCRASEARHGRVCRQLRIQGG